MKKTPLYLFVFLLACSLVWGRGNGDLARWTQEFNQGDLNRKRTAIEEIAKLKSSSAMEFLYKQVLISNQPDRMGLKVFAVQQMSSAKSPYGFYYVFQSFTLANMTFWPQFKASIYKDVNKKILLKLSKTILRARADQWPAGKAFFVDLLGAKKVKKSVRLIRPLLLKDPAPEVRKSAAYALLDLDGKKALSLLARALNDKTESVRKAVVFCLGEIGTPKAFKKVARALRDSSRDVRLVVVQMLARQKGKTFGRLLLGALRDRDKEIRSAALRGLRSVWGEKAKKYFIRATGDSDWKIRQVATFHLKDFGVDRSFVKIYKRRLKDSYPQVVSAAVWGLYLLQTKEATGVLVGALAFLQEAPLRDAINALKRLSGKDFGSSYDQWRSWWQGNQKGFYPQPQPDETFNPQSAQKAGRGTVLRRKPRFFGSVIESYHVGFIIDFSGSMSQMMTIIDRGEAGRATRERTRAKKITARRIDVAKKELIGAISHLDPRAKFNVFLFGTSYTTWKNRAVSASSDNKKSAIQFVKGNSFKGSTNLYDPLETMLKDRDIDTIYLLSDGSPNHGKYSNPTDILKEVKKINQSRKVAIYTIGVGVISFTESFLKDLAEQNGGKYIKK